VTLPEAALELGLHRSTIYRFIEQGKVKSFKKGIGRSTYVDLDELRALDKPKPVAVKPPKRDRGR
jgi:excisionase family DNA binding protein